MYIQRHIEKNIQNVAKTYGTIILTGPRKIGKTTLLQSITRDADTPIPYTTLDDPVLLQTVTDEPGIFFKNSPPPVVVDEIQHAPSLLWYMKTAMEKDDTKGQFYLSGSLQHKIRENAEEILNDKVGMLKLLGLSMREILTYHFMNPLFPRNLISKRELSSQSN